MNIDDIRTPALLIDLKRFKNNCNQMFEKAELNEIELSGHVKTHKTIQGMNIQRVDQMYGITVSTMAEAWFYAENKVKRITYAFPITADKLPEVADIQALVEEFRIVADHPHTIQAIQDYGDENDLMFNVLLKVNVGTNRAGITADSDDLIKLAIMIDRFSNMTFEGILCHSGHTYSCKNAEEIKKIGSEQFKQMDIALNRLQKNGIEVNTVSIGDTPTCSVLDSFGPATEIRPGNYVFYDRTMVDIGACSKNDVACFVLSRVISAYPDRNLLLIDAGALALSKDLGATHIRKDGTFGEIMGHPGLKLIKLSQEHGWVTSDENIDFSSFLPGTQLVIMPNHSCLTAALYESYMVINSIEEKKILDTWKPVRGW